MKKIISFIILVSVLLTLTSNCFASTNETILKVDIVFWDNNTNNYALSLLDENGEIWIIDLFKADKQNKHFLKSLQRTFKNQWLICTFDDMDTKSIYDDEIIEYSIMD